MTRTFSRRTELLICFFFAREIDVIKLGTNINQFEFPSGAKTNYFNNVRLLPL